MVRRASYGRFRTTIETEMVQTRSIHQTITDSIVNALENGAAGTGRWPLALREPRLGRLRDHAGRVSARGFSSRACRKFPSSESSRCPAAWSDLTVCSASFSSITYVAAALIGRQAFARRATNLLVGRAPLCRHRGSAKCAGPHGCGRPIALLQMPFLPKRKLR